MTKPPDLSDSAPTSAKEILDKNEFACQIYQKANDKGMEVDRLIQQREIVGKDTADQEGVEVTNMVMPFSILNRMIQMMGVHAAEYRVVPLSNTDSEEQACTRIERWLDGFKRRYMKESNRNPDKDAAYWYLLRGRANVEIRFRRDYLGKNKLPIDILVDDPATIFPVWGRREILWYTKEYTQYVRELLPLYKANNKSTAGLPEDPNEEMEIVEYMDSEFYSVVVKEGAARRGKGGNTDLLLISKPHKYGFLPLVEGRCMDTPYSSAEFAYQSVIGPVTEHIKQYYRLMSKMATGVNMFYYPLIFYKSINGKPAIWDPSLPGEPQDMDMTAKYEVLNPTPNQPLIQQLAGMLKSDINEATLPDIAFGGFPTGMHSGFAVSQILSQVQGQIDDKIPNLQLLLGGYRGQLLEIVDKFGMAQGADFKVPMDYEHG